MRQTPLRRKSYMKKGTRPLPKVNVRQQARRRKVYDAYLKSKVWREKRAACIKAAGHRCEAKGIRVVGGMPAIERCPETTRLTAHHKTYRRFGGDELPSDLQCLCAGCHGIAEALKGKNASAWLRFQEGAC